MTEEDGFLRRWARRKQEAREAGREAPEPSPEAAEAASDLPAAAEEDCDPDSLPPLESLDATSDYTVFLRKGVPKALRLAALRKAWATDPAITGYRTLAEYDWDFNAPGYGRLRPDDDPKKFVEAMFRHLRASDAGAEDAAKDTGPPAAEPPPAPEPAEPPAAEAAPFVAEAPEQEPAQQAAAENLSAPDSLAAPPRRRHGGAVPT